jgi:hypothetical protein
MCERSIPSISKLPSAKSYVFLSLAELIFEDRELEDSSYPLDVLLEGDVEGYIYFSILLANLLPFLVGV